MVSGRSWIGLTEWSWWWREEELSVSLQLSVAEFAVAGWCCRLARFLLSKLISGWWRRWSWCSWCAALGWGGVRLFSVWSAAAIGWMKSSLCSVEGIQFWDSSAGALLKIRSVKHFVWVDFLKLLGVLLCKWNEKEGKERKVDKRPSPRIFFFFVCVGFSSRVFLYDSRERAGQREESLL